MKKISPLKIHFRMPTFKTDGHKKRPKCIDIGFAAKGMSRSLNKILHISLSSANSLQEALTELRELRDLRVIHLHCTEG